MQREEFISLALDYFRRRGRRRTVARAIARAATVNIINFNNMLACNSIIMPSAFAAAATEFVRPAVEPEAGPSHASQQAETEIPAQPAIPPVRPAVGPEAGPSHASQQAETEIPAQLAIPPVRRTRRRIRPSRKKDDMLLKMNKLIEIQERMEQHWQTSLEVMQEMLALQREEVEANRAMQEVEMALLQERLNSCRSNST